MSCGARVASTHKRSTRGAMTTLPSVSANSADRLKQALDRVEEFLKGIPE